MPEYGNYYRPTPQQVLQNRQIVWSGVHPLNEELQNPATAALAGVTSGAVIWTVAEVVSQLTGEAIFKDGKKEGSFTKAVKDNLFRKGIKTDAQKLFVRGKEKDLLKQTGNLTEASWNLAKKSGGVVGNFGKELWKTPTGKWMAATVAAGALFSGGLNAYHAHRDNQNLVSSLKADKAFPQDNHQKLAFTSRGKQVVAQRVDGQLNPENSVDIKPMLSQIDREDFDF
jgi:hypothetical protein